MSETPTLAHDYVCRHCGTEGLTIAEMMKHGRQHKRTGQCVSSEPTAPASPKVIRLLTNTCPDCGHVFAITSGEYASHGRNRRCLPCFVVAEPGLTGDFRRKRREQRDAAKQKAKRKSGKLAADEVTL